MDNQKKSMKMLFKKNFLSVILTLGMVSFISCNKDNPDQFSIIGSWGMVSGTITDSNGATNRYDTMGYGSYYEYLEFRVDGSFIHTSLPDQEKTQGVYTYNDAGKTLSYKYDGDKFYLQATINVISATEMNMTTVWGSHGMTTQYFIKVK